MRVPSILVMAVAVLVARAAPAAKIFVSTTGDDANDGLSWVTAKASPRAALDLAHATMEADTVHVAEGTYIMAAGDGDIASDIDLLGGYPPGGGTERDPRVHPTVLDLDGINAKLIWFQWGSDGASIDGFTLRRSACGVYVDCVGALVRDCIIEENAYGRVASAPGLSARYDLASCTPMRVEDCVIRNNRSGTLSTGRTTFSAFSILVPWSAREIDLGLVMTRTLIQGNFHPTDLALSVGQLIGGTARIRDVAMRDNPAAEPMYVAGVDMENVLVQGGVSSVPTIPTCVPLSWRHVTAASIDLQNCDVPLYLTDSIVWGTNPAITGQVNGVVAMNSIIQGGWPSGTSIIDTDPLFTVGPEGDFYLSDVSSGQPATSPAVNAGSELASVAGLDTYTTRSDSAADEGMVDLGYHSETLPTGGLTLRRGPVADGLSPYRPIADLPFTDTEGTLTGPWFRRLYYDVPDSSREIIVRVDRATDAVRVEWR